MRMCHNGLDDNISDCTRACWTNPDTGETISTTQVNVIAAALCKCEVGQYVSVRYEIGENTHLPVERHWGDKETKYTYWHASQPIPLGNIRKCSLRGSMGARSEDYVPVLYACKQRYIPWSSCCNEDQGSILMNPCFPGGPLLFGSFPRF